MKFHIENAIENAVELSVMHVFVMQNLNWLSARGSVRSVLP